MKYRVTGVYRYWHDGLLTDVKHEDPDASFVVSLKCMDENHNYELRVPVPRSDVARYAVDSVWELHLKESVR